LVKVVLEEQLFNLLELILKVMELLIIVFFDGGYFFSNASQLSDLIFDLILEETHFILEIFDAQIFKHHYLVISVLTQQALEAYRA
jgi:hypothetical protein